MIRSEDDIRVRRLPGLFKRIEYPSDLMIQVSDDGIVLAPVKPNRIGRAREGCERLIPPEGIRADVKGMLRRKFGGTSILSTG